jgi:hypothetical protein
VGLDLGQKQDFSAVAVVERDEQGCMRVRHLERLALGTPYVNVVSRVSEIMQHPELARESRLVVDATGVGAPVVEMLRAARPAYRVTAVTITAGEHAHGHEEEWHVPKKDLMAGLQVLLGWAVENSPEAAGGGGAGARTYGHPVESEERGARGDGGRWAWGNMMTWRWRWRWRVGGGGGRRFGLGLGRRGYRGFDV